MVKNTMKLIKVAEAHMDSRYDIGVGNLQDIYSASQNPYDFIRYGFLFGYMQGTRAEKDRRKE